MPKPPGKVLIYYDDAFKGHVVPPSFPEQPARLDAALKGAAASGAPLEMMTPPEVSMEDLSAVHPMRFIEEVREAGRNSGVFDPETLASPGTYAAALKAAGAGVAAVQAVSEGKARAAFCAVRPPGHHAEPEKAQGFCIFSNVAVAATAARRRLGANRILIVDWDVHHGNGTQRIFYDDPSVFYFSIHQFPLYPGSGTPDETGRGKGRGFTLNVPIPPNSPAQTWLRAFEHAIEKIEESDFTPDIILISAGFDAYKDDPLSSQNLEPETFGRMTRAVTGLARRTKAKGIVSMLEGGYNLTGLELGVKEHIAALAEL